MCKKIILLSLLLIFNNNFGEPCAEKTATNDVDKQIILKQLDIFEKESKELQEARSSLYSTKRQIVTGVTLVAASAVIGGIVTGIAQNKELQRIEAIGVFCLTGMVIAGTLVARDMYLSNDLKNQQTCLISSIKNITLPN